MRGLGLGRERGSSVVSFLMGLPILLVFLFAIVDLGRGAFLAIAACDGAHAACQVAADAPAGDVSGAALRAAAMAASPALAGDDLAVSVTAAYGEVETATYRHHVYDGDARAFQEVAGSARRRGVEVSLAVEGSYLTPVGHLLAVAAGRSDDRFSYVARSSRTADATVEGSTP